MSRLADFVAVGDVMLDVELDELVPEERRHAAVAARPGGSAVNAALAARAAGASSAVVGRVGSDPIGDAIVAELERSDVAAAVARDPDLRTGTVVAAAAQEAVVADRGANAAFASDDVPTPLRADAVLVSGHLLAYDETAAAARAAIERAEADWIAVDAAGGADGFFERAAGANAVFADAVAAEALLDLDPQAAARRLGERYRLAAVTAGAAAAFVSVDGRLLTAAPPDRLPASRLGAGDAFAGTLLALLVRRRDPEAAVRAAVARASEPEGCAHRGR